jgi:hypothetical protein
VPIKKTGEPILPYHLLSLYALSGWISITEYPHFWGPICELNWLIENGKKQAYLKNIEVSR